MTDDYDVSKVLDGLTPTEGYEYLRSMVNDETKQAFLAKKKNDALEQAYKQEVASLDLSHLTASAKAKRLAGIKSKYRGKGLPVW